MRDSRGRGQRIMDCLSPIGPKKRSISNPTIAVSAPDGDPSSKTSVERKDLDSAQSEGDATPEPPKRSWRIHSFPRSLKEAGKEEPNVIRDRILSVSNILGKVQLGQILITDGLKNMNRKMKRSRLVRKDGGCNIYQTNVPGRDRRYLRDIFTTLIDAKWRWILGVFAVFFFITWVVFALLYYIAAAINHDFSQEYIDAVLESERTGTNLRLLTNHTVCVEKVHGFLSAFLFSVETEHTIGYGYRYITEQCPIAIISLCFQSLCGILVQSFMVGLVFAKMARPKKRAETLIFSEKAVISLRDGQLCFLIRVGDMRISHLVEAHIRLQMITNRTTAEGEVEPLYQYDMDVGYDDGTDRIFLVWPLTICHVIDEDSPLYEFSARQLPTAQFEIIALLEGIVESTGMTTQAKTSYLPSEILWGHRCEKLVTYQKCNGSYQIDYSLFHNTYPVNTPRCSAKELDRMKAAGVQLGSSGLFFCKTQEEAELEESCTEAPPSMENGPVQSLPALLEPQQNSTHNALSTHGASLRRSSSNVPPQELSERLIVERSSPSPPPVMHPAPRRRRSSFHPASRDHPPHPHPPPLPSPLSTAQPHLQYATVSNSRAHRILINSPSQPAVSTAALPSPGSPPVLLNQVEGGLVRSGLAVQVPNTSANDSFSNVGSLISEDD